MATNKMKFADVKAAATANGGEALTPAQTELAKKIAATVKYNPGKGPDGVRPEASPAEVASFARFMDAQGLKTPEELREFCGVSPNQRLWNCNDAIQATYQVKAYETMSGKEAQKGQKNLVQALIAKCEMEGRGALARGLQNALDCATDADISAAFGDGWFDQGKLAKVINHTKAALGISDTSNIWADIADQRSSVEVDAAAALASGTIVTTATPEQREQF